MDALSQFYRKRKKIHSFIYVGRNDSMLNDLLFCCSFPISCDDHCLPSCHLQICGHNGYRNLSLLCVLSDRNDDVPYGHRPSFHVLLQSENHFQVKSVTNIQNLVMSLSQTFFVGSLFVAALV